jgi:hypothetical protein
MLLGPLFLGLLAEITSIKTSFIILPIMAFFIFSLSKHLSLDSEV